MDDLKQYFDQLLRRSSYRGWHIVQADRITHEAITKALQGIIALSVEGKLVATDETLSQLNRAMDRGDSALPVRKQVLVNLDALGLIEREGIGQQQLIILTPEAHEYLEYEDKEFYMDRILENFEIHVPTSLRPFPILLRIMSDQRFTELSVHEFQYFISQITSEQHIEEVIQQILTYRALSDEQKVHLDGYIRQQCHSITEAAERQNLPKPDRRDYTNWVNNARHSLEFFSLGSQIKLIDNTLHILLGSDALRRKILGNLQLLDEKFKIHKQVVHFRDKKVMDDLKKLYSYYCQFCGYNYIRIPTKHGFYVEAAHIIPVSEQSSNEANLNDPSNIVIACANHHKTIDLHFPAYVKQIITFDDGRKGLETVDGSERLYLTLNEHIN